MVPGLMSDKEYMFRVRPVNRVGEGEALEQAQPLRLVSPYSESHDDFVFFHSFWTEFGKTKSLASSRPKNLVDAPQACLSG